MSLSERQQIQIRHPVIADFYTIHGLIDDWWGGRPVRHLLPRLFFEHFYQTSFCVVDGPHLVAFLIGFISPAQTEQAYIHFVGVNPAYRRQAWAGSLYQRFFELVKAQGVHTVKAITSPQNLASIAFHQALGFTLVSGDYLLEGIPVHANYAGPEQDRVVFLRQI